LTKSNSRILAVIVIAQFCCTSLWFAGNGVMQELLGEYNLSDSALGHLTSSVQFGFIIGTLVFAILTLADRYSPSKVFFLSAFLGATFNVLVVLKGHSLMSLLVLRLLTGFFLAGIYPVGMKIAADYFEKGLGRSLGYLVGALVIGTAFPHLLNDIIGELSWRYVLALTSLFAVGGGILMMILVPDGPFRKASQALDTSAMIKVFKNKRFRSAAIGYFGHMWELYAFWAFVPLMLLTYQSSVPQLEINIPLLSFMIIGVGGISCVIGGYLSESIGAKKVAFSALALSCLCCIVSPWILTCSSPVIVITFLIFWGLVVIADSPLFSTLVAHNAEPEMKGTALTIVNCIGFGITIVSIQLLSWLQVWIPVNYTFLFLALGPIVGLIVFGRVNQAVKN
jgi:MFS family permease